MNMYEGQQFVTIIILNIYFEVPGTWYLVRVCRRTAVVLIVVTIYVIIVLIILVVYIFAIGQCAALRMIWTDCTRYDQ